RHRVNRLLAVALSFGKIGKVLALHPLVRGVVAGHQRSPSVESQFTLGFVVSSNRGNRMSPTHANKGGARYRYYVSQAVLQNKPPPSGLVGRVPAAEIEALVVAALRNHLSASSAGEQLPDNDRDLLERHLERVTLTPNHLELRLRQIIEPAQAH